MLEDRRLLAAGWPVRAGGFSSESATCVAPLPDGSSLVGGWLLSQSFALGDTTVGSALNSGADGFVAKLDRDGAFVWALELDSAYAPSFANVMDIATFPDGSAIATGIFRGTITIGGTTLVGADEDMFVTKINADGSVSWARRAGGSADEWSEEEGGWGVAALADGSAVVAGNFSSSATFGDTKITASGESSYAGFVAKYAAGGDVAWVRAFDATTSCRAWDVASLPDGSTIVTGSFAGTMTFGSTTLTSDKGSSDTFIARLDPAGSVVWARRGGGVGRDWGRAVTTMPDGTAFVTGSFTGKATFGGSTVGGASETDQRSFGFLSKIGSNGSFAWTKAFAPNVGRSIVGRGVSAFPDGSVIVTHVDSGTGDSGGRLSMSRLKANGASDWFKYWSVKGTGWGVSARPDGTAIVTGNFRETAQFSQTIQLATANVSNDHTDLFVAKISKAGSFDLPPGTPTIASCTPGDRSVTVTWSEAAGNGRPVSDYIVEYRLASQVVPKWKALPNVLPSNATTRTVNGLSNGAAYVFRVKAVNAVGAGAPGAQSSPVVPRAIPGTPGRPTGMSGDGQVTLTWKAPGTGGTPITRYDILYTAQGGQFWATMSVAPTATAATISSLTNGVGYVFRVAAVNAVGSGGLSEASAAVVPRGRPTAPTSFTAVPGTRSATLSWGSPASDGASPITGYTIRYALKTDFGLGPWITTTRSASGRPTTVIDGLVAGGRYVFQIAAVNAIGTGASAQAEIHAGSGR